MASTHIIPHFLPIPSVTTQSRLGSTLLLLFLTAFTFRYLILPFWISWDIFYTNLIYGWFTLSKYLWSIVFLIAHTQRIARFTAASLRDLRAHWEFYLFVATTAFVVDGAVVVLRVPGWLLLRHWPVVWRSIFTGRWDVMFAPLRVVGVQWGVLWGLWSVQGWVKGQWVLVAVWTGAWVLTGNWWRRREWWPTEVVGGVYGHRYSVVAVGHRAYLLWVRWTPWFFLTAFVAYCVAELVLGRPKCSVLEIYSDSSSSDGDDDDEEEEAVEVEEEEEEEETETQQPTSPPRDRQGRNIYDEYEIEGVSSSDSSVVSNTQWRAKKLVRKPIDMNQSFRDSGSKSTSSSSPFPSPPKLKKAAKGAKVGEFPQWAAKPPRSSPGRDMAASFYQYDEEVEVEVPDTVQKRNAHKAKAEFRQFLQNATPEIPRLGHTPLAPMFPMPPLPPLPSWWGRGGRKKVKRRNEDRGEEYWDQGLEEDEEEKKRREKEEEEEAARRREKKRRDREEEEERRRKERRKEKQEEEVRKRKEKEEEEARRLEKKRKEKEEEERRRKAKEEREKKEREKKDKEKKKPDHDPKPDDPPSDNDDDEYPPPPLDLPAQTPEQEEYRWEPPPPPIPNPNPESTRPNYDVNARRFTQEISMEGLFDSDDSEDNEEYTPEDGKRKPKIRYIKMIKLYHEDDSDLDYDPATSTEEESESEYDSEWELQSIPPNSDHSSDDDWEPAAPKVTPKKTPTKADGEGVTDVSAKKKGKGSGAGKKPTDEAPPPITAPTTTKKPQAGRKKKPAAKGGEPLAHKRPKPRGGSKKNLEKEPTRASRAVTSAIGSAIRMMRPITIPPPSPSPPPLPEDRRGERFATPEDFEEEHWHRPRVELPPVRSRWRRLYLLGFLLCFFWYLVGDLYREPEDYLIGPGLSAKEFYPVRTEQGWHRWRNDEVQSVSYDTGEVVR